MNPISNNTTEKKAGSLLKTGKAVNIIYSWFLNHFTALFIAICFVMIFNPADASTGQRNNKKCGHRVVKSSIVYPVINKVDRHSPGYSKNLKKTRSRSYSFPV